MPRNPNRITLPHLLYSPFPNTQYPLPPPCTTVVSQKKSYQGWGGMSPGNPRFGPFPPRGIIEP